MSEVPLKSQNSLAVQAILVRRLAAPENTCAFLRHHSGIRQRVRSKTRSKYRSIDCLCTSDPTISTTDQETVVWRMLIGKTCFPPKTRHSRKDSVPRTCSLMFPGSFWKPKFVSVSSSAPVVETLMCVIAALCGGHSVSDRLRECV